MSGYKKIRLSRTETRDEHRIIVEQHLGRRLRRDEEVRHKNGAKRDNRLENLEVIQKSEHARMHFNRQLIEVSAAARRGKSNVNCRKLSDLEVSQVNTLIRAGVGPRAIARCFNVSRYTIRRIKNHLTAYARAA